MKVTDYIEMNQHDKKTIYEAYSIETAARKHLNKLLNDSRRETAKMRFQSQAWQDAWLLEHVRNNVDVAGDKEEALDYYFAHSMRDIIFTPDNGYIAYVIEEDHVFIVFAWTNPKAWKAEMKNMVENIRLLAKGGLPVRYTGVNNVLKNHSVEVEDGLYELRI